MKHYNFSVPLYSKEQIYVAMQTKEIVAALVASAFQIDVDIAKTEIVSHSKWGWRERILLNLAIKTKNGLVMADAAVFVCDNSEACAKVAKVASKILRDGRYSPSAKAAAGSALSQTPGKKHK